ASASPGCGRRMSVSMPRAGFLRLALGAVAGGWLASKPGLAAAANAASYDFWFTRLKYDSGDWDVDERMPSNLITSLIDYTGLRVDPEEHVVEDRKSTRLNSSHVKISYAV